MKNSKSFELGLDEVIIREGIASFFKTENMSIGGRLYITSKRVAFCSRTAVQNFIVIFIWPALFFIKPRKIVFDIPIEDVALFRKSKTGAIKTKTLSLITKGDTEKKLTLHKLDNWISDIRNGFSKLFDVKATTTELIFNSKTSK